MRKILITFVIILIIILFLAFPKSDKSKFNDEETFDNKYAFYKEANEKRYLIYQEKNKELGMEDIIIRVNLNLDKPFYSDISEAKNLNTNYILVNKYNYLSKDYVPKNLEKLDSCTNKDIFLVKEAKDNFIKMCSDINKDKLTIRAISGYRSYTYQEVLYNKYVEKDGVEIADTYSARPGFSEHQTGLVVDIDNGREYYENFENTDEFKWLQENAYKYGFILRYPQKKESITGYSYESWHYRYVGYDIAKQIQEQHITFDEFFIKSIDN